MPNREALYTPYPSCIFRWTANSEQETRQQGGIPTAVSYQGGKASFDGSSSYINFGTQKGRLTPSGTIRVRVRPNDGQPNADQLILGRYLTTTDNREWGVLLLQSGVIGFRTSANGLNVFNWTTTSEVFTNGSQINYKDIVITYTLGGSVIIYINGSSVVSSGSIQSSIFKSLAQFFIGSISNPVSYFSGDIDLVEQYSRALTASEIANLFSNSAFVVPRFGSYIETLGTELITNGSFTGNMNGWNAGAPWVYGTNNMVTVNCNNNLGQFGTLVVGSIYRVSFNISSYTSGELYFDFGGGAFKTFSSAGIKTFDMLYTEGGLKARFYGGTVTCTLDDVSVKLLTTSGTLLNLQSCNGVLQSLTSVVPVQTATTFVQSGSFKAIKTDNLTTKIDCGTDFVGIGNMSFAFWVKPMSFGEGNNGTILSNGKAILRVNSTNSKFEFTSDGSTYVSAGTNSIVLGKWYLVGGIRKSSGLWTFCIGTITTPPVFGTETTSGTPSSASVTNLTILNNSGQTATFGGLFKMGLVNGGLLTITDFTKYWSSTLFAVK